MLFERQQFKPHDRSLLNGCSLLEQIELNSLERMEIAHSGSHYDSVVPNKGHLSGKKLLRLELSFSNTLVID